jgi:hypothetical protein
VNKTYEHILNPKNFQIDDREVLDFILFIKEYSKGVHFYNKKNKKEGTWYELLKSDETFLIAEISKFDILKFSIYRVNLIKKYDEAFSIEGKKLIFNEFYNSTLSLFQQINEWYLSALKNNLTQESSLIETELETAIQQKISALANDFIKITESFIEKKILNKKVSNKFSVFNSIWELNSFSLNENENENENADVEIFDEGDLNFAFKKITLIFNPTYEIVYNLVLRSKKLFSKSLYENDNHKAHIGLLFSFLELFRHSLDDLNTFTKKHLDLYFKQVLKLKHLKASSAKIFVSFEIDENIDFLNVESKSILKVGQMDNGEDILFDIDENIELNNIALSHISTFFLSENKVFDHQSRFNLISGLYSKIHASSEDEVNSFNSNKTYFSSLGEEQLFLRNEDMNMEKASIGFMLASPVLLLSKSDRTIDIDFKFTIDSIKYLSDLIIDIAQNKSLTEEVVFDEIFFNAFQIAYTSEDEWTSVLNYKVISPEDWSTGIIRVSFILDKTFPGITAYNPDIHIIDIVSSLPLLKFKLNQDSFYNPYSFLNSMELHKVDLNVKVENLKNFNCYVNNEEIDIKSEFEIFGVTPKKGSNMVLGTEELFNKKIKELSVSWEFKNLNILNETLEEYYKEYDLGIKNDTFKVKVSALSNFKYSTSTTSELVYDLFDQTEEGILKKDKSLGSINVDALKIKPNYKLKSSDLEEFSNDLETGYLKIELVEPKFAFGTDLYGKVFNKITQKSLQVKPNKAGVDMLKFPNEPYAPSISDLSLNYKAHSTLIFNQSLFSENDFEEENSFYLISPFGVENTFSKNSISKNTIVESFNYEGELILGFNTIKQSFQLNLLFEIVKSENQNYEFSRKLDWYYSSAEGWKLFQDSDILYDQTMNLMKTGVLSLRAPSDISAKKNELNESNVFIKACSKNKTNQFSMIQSIQTNSASASEILNDLYESDSKYIPPYSVEGFLKPIEGVINTEQRLGSIKGNNKESDMDFYIRSSELLRHKNRPITKWDFEKFILSKFTWLSNVKCYSINRENSQLNIQLLCIKKIEQHENINNIKLSSAEKNEIKIFLQSYTSPFSKIEIINPVFEDLWIKCKVLFKNISNGKGIQKLHIDFFNFICSWLYDSSEKNKIGIKIKKLDIINFLNNRPYISFITAISLIHIKKLENGTQFAYDSAQENINNDYIEHGVRWSIIVPKHNHKIEVIENSEYHSPEPINFNELGIEESFLINSEIRDDVQVIENSNNESNKTDSKFNFKLKL